jgi:alpha-glucosidase (family GH31 glycosyl hydrolase)
VDTGRSPNAETFARWLAMSAHSPMMEILNGPNRTLWYSYDTGPNATNKSFPSRRTFARGAPRPDSVHPLARLRLDANGHAAMRMMPLSFPDDPAVADMFDEFLLGDSLLHCTGAQGRRHEPSRCTCPAACGSTTNDKKTRHTGPATITASAPLDAIPRYVKGGAIVPRGDILQSKQQLDAQLGTCAASRVLPCPGLQSRFDYYTGKAVVPMTGSMTGSIGELAGGRPGDQWSPRVTRHRSLHVGEA